MANDERFFIYENWQAGLRKAVIHRGSCGHCNDGKGAAGGYDPRHALWHGPFDNLQTARNASNVTPNIVNRSECRCVHSSDGLESRGIKVNDAAKIRVHALEKYVMPARNNKERRFSIRAGDVVRELGMSRGTPAVCSALGGRKFWQANNLRIVEVSGPPSGQSTTVTYTYEFLDSHEPFSLSSSPANDPWKRLRGALKAVFAELGGGEAYLRAERSDFYKGKENT